MKQTCKIINLGDSAAIICGSDITDHECNEEAMVFGTASGKSLFFEDGNVGQEWYRDTEENVTSGSVACSICGRAAIDDAHYLP